MINISELVVWLVLLLAYAGILCVAAFRLLWKHKFFFVQGIYTLLGVSLLLVAANGMTFFIRDAGMLFGITLLCACFLTARIHIGRLPSEFLRHNTLTTGFMSLVVAAGLLWTITALPPLPFISIAIALLSSTLALAIGLSLQTGWALRHYIFDVKAKPVSHGSLPTVTLAIPARNETLALAACLDAALQSDYEKLEILVLDDCSHDNTSGLIRSYAHAGVRFVRGETPNSGWLGKTNAYNQLAQESSGEIIFFIGVDTQLQAETISRLVHYLDAHQLNMVSVLPRLAMPFGASVLLQNMRYIWQVMLPLTKRRVPVSSEAWMIRRGVLEALGGFAGVKHKIIPEGSFARRLMAQNRYHFIIANRMLPMVFTKSWHSQQNTAIRLLYPTLKRRPLRTIATVLLLAIGGLMPFLVLLFAEPYSLVWWLAAATSLMYVLLYAFILWRIQTRWWWLGVWLLPLVLLQEIILILMSMAKYEFSIVDWKGRNVCYPVLLHKRR